MAYRQNDLAGNRLAFLLLWVLPPVAMMVAVFAGTSHSQVSVVWTVCLLVMSAGCFVNAIRCGRLHCALTGPFFLLMAVSTLLYGLEVLSLGDFGWELIGAVTAAGGLTLKYVPEALWGKYLRR